MDPTKFRLVRGAVRVEVDDPLDRMLKKPMGMITGWFAMAGYEAPDEFEFHVGPISLPHTAVKRPDVQEVIPEYSVGGFQIQFDLSHYLFYIDSNRLVIRLTLPGYDPIAIRFALKEGVLADCIAAASGDG